MTEPTDVQPEPQSAIAEPGEKIDRRATRVLYPTGAAHIVGDDLVGSPAAVVTHANPAAAERILSYRPAAFETKPTDFSALLGDTPEVVLIAYPPESADKTPED